MQPPTSAPDHDSCSDQRLDCDTIDLERFRNHAGANDIPITPTTLTLKDIPDEVHERLKAAAELRRRSLNNEAVVSLEAVLIPGVVNPSERLARARKLRVELTAGNVRTRMIVVDSNVREYAAIR